MANIVLVEDNSFIREAISGYLQLENHTIIEFGGVNGVFDSIKTKNIDLIILDVMLPDGNGFALAKKIRGKYKVPIIFLTAKDSESDRILGFEIGADDYVVKPFSARELTLRVEALLKRCHQEEDDLQNDGCWFLTDQKLEIDIHSHKLLLNESEINLTGAEWKILLFLVEREGEVISRSRILTECLNYMFEGSERTVDTHIGNLRSKLGSTEWIKTIRGFGYRFTGTKDKGSQ
jgi:two-component system phosphate regulon response regulator PhoB